MQGLITFVVDNWVVIVAIITPVIILAEKIVKITPTKYDDIILDMIVKPIFNALKGKK